MGSKPLGEALKKSQNRGRGRPRGMTGGRQVHVYLDDESIAVAESLGEGNVSSGIRRALQICKEMEGDDVHDN